MSQVDTATTVAPEMKIEVKQLWEIDKTCTIEHKEGSKNALLSTFATLLDESGLRRLAHAASECADEIATEQADAAIDCGHDTQPIT